MSLDSYSFAHTSVVKRQSGKRRSIICMTFVMTSSKVRLGYIVLVVMSIPST